MHWRSLTQTPGVTRGADAGRPLGRSNAENADLGNIRSGDVARYQETSAARWVRKGLTVVVALCCGLAAYIWWRLLAGLP
jgi:hypothetical protein